MMTWVEGDAGSGLSLRVLLPLVAVLLVAGCVDEAEVTEIAAAPEEAPVEAPVSSTEGVYPLRMTGACLGPPLRGCAGLSETATGDLAVPTDLADVEVTFTWDADLPGEERVRLALEGPGGFAASIEGGSPLAWSLGEIPAGRYTLQGEFAAFGAGPLAADLAWTLAARSG